MRDIMLLITNLQEVMRKYRIQSFLSVIYESETVQLANSTKEPSLITPEIENSFKKLAKKKSLQFQLSKKKNSFLGGDGRICRSSTSKEIQSIQKNNFQQSNNFKERNFQKEENLIILN
jgi:hypothetical protein